MKSPIGPWNPPFKKMAGATIQKDKDNNYQITFTNFGSDEGQPYGGVYIANSKENLDKYLGKKLHIQASYQMNQANTDAIQTNTQCIADKCHQLFPDKNQKVYGVNIEKIEVLK